MNLKVFKKFRSVLAVSLVAAILCMSCDKSEDPLAKYDTKITVKGFGDEASIMKGSKVSLQINVDDTDKVDMLSILIDGRLIESFTTIPVDYVWNTSEVEAGDYSLEFYAYKEGAEVGLLKISVKITPPITVTDYDGNVYTTVQIGSQIWMVENLKTTHYRNGDLIPNTTGDESWCALLTGALCDYKGVASNGEMYGHLYNFFAVEDSRGICPDGWHVPTRQEYHDLIEFLGGQILAPDKLKEEGARHWSSTITTAVNYGTNESGFTALPGGVRTASGPFTSIGYMAYLWTREGNNSSFSGSRYGFARTIGISNEVFDLNNFHAYMGMSVRCIKDAD